MNDIGTRFALMWQEGVTEKQLGAVKRGIRRVSSISGIPNPYIWEAGMQWTFPWTDANGIPILDESVESWILYAQSASALEEHVDATRILERLPFGPQRKGLPHHAVVALDVALYRDKERHDADGALKTFHDPIIGIAKNDIGTVLTVRSLGVDEQDVLVAIELLTMHEVGHVKGLFACDEFWVARTRDIEETEEGGKHCALDCVMNFGLDRKMKIKARLLATPFCAQCKAFLRRHIG